MGAFPTTAAAQLRDASGSPERRRLACRVEKRITYAMWMAHGLGALDLFALLFWVLPSPDGVKPADHLVPNLVGLAFYFPLATAIGTYVGKRMSPVRADWVLHERTPTADERDAAINMPMHCLRLDAWLWLGGLALFAAINLAASAELALHVATTIFLGGITTCAVAYLLVERIARPITELALAGGAPRKPAWPGVEGRMLLAWACATGMPVLGIIMVACKGLAERGDPEDISRSVLVLGIAALVIGLSVTLLTARTLSRPLSAMRRALARVEAGDLSAEVRVDDASEVGLLQSGFNRMVGGLRERERVQDLYSRQVGEDVALAALRGDPRLGGQVCDVAVLFVDMVGSTSLASTLPPEQVVDRLNRFFAIVVDAVGEHGGWVNKFEGDAALCVFGAPVPQDDPAGCALAAGRDLQARLRRDMPSADAGIGLSAGEAVAGWVGAERRFEYTVIGDPVNEAARLCELAKRRPERLLASEAIVTRAADGEAGRWRVGEQTVLRGRTTPTRLAAPA